MLKTGEKHGRLTVIEVAESKSNGKYWSCKCDCGNLTKATTNQLRTGHTRSCGCLHRDRITKHGDHKTRLYSIWNGMKLRCSESSRNKSSYKHYAGKGIRVCDEWLEYTSFKKWALANGYEDDLSIERNDNSKGYNPQNCRWIPLSEQPSNTSRNAFIEYGGETLTLSQWSRKLGINTQTLKGRYWRGDRGAHLFRPSRGGKV